MPVERNEEVGMSTTEKEAWKYERMKKKTNSSTPSAKSITLLYKNSTNDARGPPK